MYVCGIFVCVCVVVFGGELHRSRRAVVRSFAGGVSVRARAARVGHWRSSGRAFDQGRASPSRQLYRAILPLLCVYCHSPSCLLPMYIHNNIILYDTCVLGIPFLYHYYYTYIIGT
uniref:Secreted protein n=1 Tax=Schizaphis graminum TaxID=13262 RepID=A0A2S2NM33_SCHGA